jgi:hypothetical protein
LVEFLLARISEDETAARAAFQIVDGRDVGGWYWSNAGNAVFVDDSDQAVACGPWQQLMHQRSAHHMVRWDPERVVAECVAKRRVVERQRGRARTGVLRHLALVYADHPDYRDRWLPRPSRDPLVRRGWTATRRLLGRR